MNVLLVDTKVDYELFQTNGDCFHTSGMNLFLENELLPNTRL